MTDQIPITDEKLKAALHDLRVEFAEWQLQEFPLFGFDAIRQMGMRGLCSQEEADAAIAEASKRHPDRDVGLPTADEVRGLFRDDMADERPF